MDTRQKIVSLTDLPPLLAGGGAWIAVAGLFDPLTLVQAERLAAAADQAKCKLLAVISPDNATLLPAEARAALVASLRRVDAVVVATAAEVGALGFTVDDDPAAEVGRSADFVNFVLQR